MFFNKKNADSIVRVDSFEPLTGADMVDKGGLLIQSIGVPPESRAYLLSATDGKNYPTQGWILFGADHYSNYYDLNILAIVSPNDNGESITYYYGSQIMATSYQVQGPVDSTNIQDIIDSIYNTMFSEEGDSSNDISQEESCHCNENIEAFSNVVKDIITKEYISIQSYFQEGKKSLEEIIENLKLEENININTQVDSVGLNTVLNNIDNALINLENSLSAINTMIREAGDLVDKDSQNKSDSISLAASKLDSAAKILQDQIDASLTLNSTIRMNINDISLIQNNLISSINQSIMDSNLAATNLVKEISNNAADIKERINQDILNNLNLTDQVSKNNELVVNNVLDLRNMISQLNKRIDNYDANICASNFEKKQFHEDLLKFFKKAGIIVLSSFWIIVLFLFVKEVIL
jgi:hypothetical protein